MQPVPGRASLSASDPRPALSRRSHGVRAIAAEHVLVHQIWLGKKRKHALESNYSAEELNVVQRDIGRLAQYTVEMGGGVELLETALRIPPWEPLYRLSADELQRM